jgi:outer membrane protein TolC
MLAGPAAAGPAGQSASESPRWQTVREGDRIRLSLADAIALALESSLDIELQRVGLGIADADIQRAEAGSQGRGVTLSVREGPRSVSGSALAAVGTSPIGPGGEANLSLAGGQSVTAGPLPPSFDAVLAGSLRWSRQNLPQANAFSVGTSVLESDVTAGGLSFLQGFHTGGQLAVTFDAASPHANNRRVDVNPYTQAVAGISFTQPLLRGAGTSLNARFIRITKRNREVADLVFQQQVVSTVSAVIRLYWDLASLTAEVDVRRQNLARSEKLLSDTAAQVDVGTRADIDAVRARAEVARARRDLIAAEGLARQQELRLEALHKQVAVEIQNALIALAQARATLESAAREREFQERALAAEEERLGVGVSTTYLVIQYQRDLAQAQSAEAAARAGYSIARAALDRATGRLLEEYGIVVTGGDARIE